MASSRRYRRRHQQAKRRHRMALERLEERLALSATASLDPSTYAAGSLLVKLKDPVADLLQYKSSGDELFGISSLSASTATINPLAGLPTSVSDVLAGYGASGFGRVFPSVSSAGQDDTLFGISSLTASASNTTSDAPDDTTAWEIGLDRWVRIDLPEDADLEAIMASLEGDVSIAAVEPDFLFRLSGAVSPPSTVSSSYSATSVPTTSTDPAVADQWHLDAIKAPEAWAYLESQGLPAGGSSDIVVAVIDTGVDYTHEDLAANMWVNAQEIPGNGIDDDGNGFIDDIHGVAVVSDYRSHSGDPMDDHAHGTHVAGIVAASANNGLGGVGVAYNSKIMAIKALQYSGVGASTDIAEAIYYAVENGADIINMSFGSYSESRIVRDALEVAFGQCVLVAAAGNDALRNDLLPMYPAAYNWVLGVEAATTSGGRADFSNWDKIQYTRNEYEVRAPGVDVYSSLPNNQYAAWDGTSMAAPAVSGLAALLRTRFFNKDLYSSRFIMGQVAAVSTDAGGVALIDAMHALTNTPKPNLTLLDYWVFDTASQDPDNDDDGRVDAGETIDLAIALKNRWGKAEDVTVTLEAWANGAVAPDPYVTITTATVNYGAIGSFNEDDNGLTYDADGVITGVNVPFTFTTLSDTPNDHVIPFRVRITARNGLDADDQTTYSWTTGFSITVQRGRELPRVISEDMTLTKDDFWIVNGPTLIEAGVTVVVEPGTHIQWGAPPSEDPYAPAPQSAYIQNEGNLFFRGTANEMVRLFPLYPDGFHDAIDPFFNAAVVIDPSGRTTYEFAEVINGTLRNVEAYDSVFRNYIGGQQVGFLHLERCVFTGAGVNLFPQYQFSWFPGVNDRPESGGAGYPERRFVENLLNLDYLSGWEGPSYGDAVPVYDSVFLADLDARVYNMAWGRGGRTIAGNSNAFLNPLWKTGSLPLTVSSSERDYTVDAANNFWGTTNASLIERVIEDFSDDFNLGRVEYLPLLGVAPATAYPFVVDVVLSTDAGDDVLQVGAEPVTFTVTYNRDMDTSVQPQISFGPDQPVTDYTIHPVNGGWQDPRTWVGVFKVSPLTGDGYQLIRTAGARAADKTWLETAVDKGRFRFEIITSGAESMNLQATGAPGRVELSWMQDDFDLLAGYNVYRSTAADGTYQRVNSTLIPAATKSFVDTTVVPGNTYFYTFRVAQTDGSESGDSNIASAGAQAPDTTPPVIAHTAATAASAYSAFTVRADVTDNASVEAVTLHYRPSGAVSFAEVGMTFTTNARYSATLPAGTMLPQGIEYFIEASDGSNVTTSGTAEAPHQITVVPVAPELSTFVGLSAPITVGEPFAITVKGSKFDPSATVSLSGTGTTLNSFSVLDTSTINISVTFTVAASSSVQTVEVINPGGYASQKTFSIGTLANDEPLLRMFVHENEVGGGVASYHIPAFGSDGQPLAGRTGSIVATSSRVALIAAPTTIYGSPGVPSSISFTPAIGVSGVAVITLQVEDGGADDDLGTAEDNGVATHQIYITVLEIISSASAVILSKDESNHIYAATQPIMLEEQQAPSNIMGFAALGADSGGVLLVERDGTRSRIVTEDAWKISSLFHSLRNETVGVLNPVARQPVEFALTAIPGAYVIDSLTNPTLTVHRGQKVTFDLSVTGHPFYLQTTGGGYVEANVYSEGFTGNGETTGRFEWIVPEEAPDELFYQCEFHPVMFGKIVVVD